jgi:hypothetical protein
MQIVATNLFNVGLVSNVDFLRDFVVLGRRRIPGLVLGSSYKKHC